MEVGGSPSNKKNWGGREGNRTHPITFLVAESRQKKKRTAEQSTEPSIWRMTLWGSGAADAAWRCLITPNFTVSHRITPPYHIVLHRITPYYTVNTILHRVTPYYAILFRKYRTPQPKQTSSLVEGPRTVIEPPQHGAWGKPCSGGGPSSVGTPPPTSLWVSLWVGDRMPLRPSGGSFLH